MTTRPQFDLSFMTLKPAELNAFLKPYTDTIKTSKRVTSDVIKYSFYSSREQLPDSATNDSGLQGPFSFKAFTSQEKAVANSVLSMLQTSTGLKFQEVTAGEGELRFGKYNMASTFAGYTYNPGDFSEKYTPLFINTNLEGNARAFTQTFLHELGHALNFKHPGIYDSGDSNPVLPANLDTSLLSVMSYSDYEYNMSFSPLDLKALMELYGVNSNPTPKKYLFTASGNTATQSVDGNEYQINMVGKDIFWIVDGPHTYDFSRAEQGSQGLYVNAAIGAVRWSTPEDWLKINAWRGKGADAVDTLAKISEYANVRFFYPDSSTVSGTITSSESSTPGGRQALAKNVASDADPVSKLILSEHNDVIVMLENESVFNFIDTGEGNDRFVGFIDGIVVDGGGGIDDMQLFGMRDEFQIVRTEAGFIISDTNEDSLSIEEIDRLHFDDVSVAFDYDGNAGDIYRAYTMFGRSPDLEGMGYWIDAMDEGMDDIKLANCFENSEEFMRHYAGTDNLTFLQKLYANALQREADADGLAYWLAQLDNGVSRTSVIHPIVQSPESVALYASAGLAGMTYQEWEWFGSM